MIAKAYLKNRGVNSHTISQNLKLLGHPIELFQRRHDVYLVYTAGKVGSTSLYDTLTLYVKSPNIFHCHWLSSAWLQDSDIPKRPKAIHKAKKIHRLISRENKLVKIVTVVRDPIARQISSAFQNPHKFGRDEKSLASLSLEEACTFFVERPASFFDGTWFEEEFKLFTGIDIYAGHFCHELKKQTESLGQFQVLCLRLEDFKDEHLIASHLSNFCDAGVDRLLRSNLAADKAVGSLYKEAVSTIRFSRPLLEEVYSSQYCQHFYTEEERQGFIGKWARD